MEFIPFIYDVIDVRSIVNLVDMMILGAMKLHHYIKSSRKVVWMRDVFPVVENWMKEGESFAIAVVVNTWGSSPRAIGSWMVVNKSGELHGSVSGGCVEGAVIDEALKAIENQQPKKLHFGVKDETAWDVGLACGGEIDVFVRPLLSDLSSDQTALKSIKSSLDSKLPFIFTMVLDGPDEFIGQLLVVTEDEDPTDTPVDHLLHALREKARELLPSHTSDIETFQFLDNKIDLFYKVYLPPLKLIIVGGAHISIALAAYAKVLGYEVYVVDPRGVFGTSARFPEVDGLVNAWPDQGLEQIGLDAHTAIAILSHDPKLDDPALRLALRSKAFYLGALGSRKTQIKRRERLAAEGLEERQLARLHGPIGLDLGGSSPEEIALSIMAEIVSVHSGMSTTS